MLQLIVENQYGEQLNFSNVRDYAVKVTGLTPGTATINMTKIAAKDGSKFNSSTLDERNIVLTIFPCNSVEQNRINLYKYLRLKQYVKLYLKNGRRDVWIEGRIESIEGDLYEAPQQLQVSIICPDPYFKAVNATICEFSAVNPLFSFPVAFSSEGSAISQLDTYLQKNILNDSDEETGIIVDLYATGTALEPTIHNITTGETFTVNHEFNAGDKVRLNTRTGEKSLTLVRDGTETNILNQMEIGSKWFTLRVGDNLFSYTAVQGAENLRVTINLQPIFTGV